MPSWYVRACLLILFGVFVGSIDKLAEYKQRQCHKPHAKIKNQRLNARSVDSRFSAVNDRTTLQSVDPFRTCRGVEREAESADRRNSTIAICRQLPIF